MGLRQSGSMHWRRTEHPRVAMRTVPSFHHPPPHACSSASTSRLATISLTIHAHYIVGAIEIIKLSRPLLHCAIVSFRPSLSLSLPPACWIMETRAGKRPLTHPPEDPPGRRPSKDLRRAAEAAKAFSQFTSPQAQQDTIEAEKRIWDKVEQAKFDGELDEFKPWVKDPGYTTGRLALYDRALAYYWAAKQLYGLLLDERSSKGGDDLKYDKIWRTHCRETHMIHIKLDIIAKKLGFPFLPQDTAANLMNGEDNAKPDMEPAPQQPQKNE